MALTLKLKKKRWGQKAFVLSDLEKTITSRCMLPIYFVFYFFLYNPWVWVCTCLYFLYVLFVTILGCFAFTTSYGVITERALKQKQKKITVQSKSRAWLDVVTQTR